MRREAFKMFLKKGYEAEYEKRHGEIWPELKHRRPRREQLQHLLGQGDQRAVCRAKGEGRFLFARYGHEPHRAKMVGVHG